MIRHRAFLRRLPSVAEVGAALLLAALWAVLVLAGG